LYNKAQTTLIQYAIGKTATSFSIPNTVNNIGSGAFEYCTSLTSVTIPSSVTSIDTWTFADCTSLTSVTIPSSVTSIESYAFYNCTSLTSVTIPSSVTSIGDYAFYHCTSLKSVTIPSSVTSIGSNAFEDCTSLTSVTIPSSVTSIAWHTFGYCTSLTSVTIPSSVTSIGSYAFYKCTSLEDVYYTGTESEWNNISIDSSNSRLTNATKHYSVQSYDYSISNNETITVSTSSTYKYIAFVPKDTGTYDIYSSGSYDTVGCITDYSGNQLNNPNNDDDAGSGRNFKMSTELTGGQLYLIGVRQYGSDTSEITYDVTVEKQEDTESPTTEFVTDPAEATTTVAPTTEAPTTVAPTTIAPTTAFITDPTEAPTTEAPTTVVPTTIASTTAFVTEPIETPTTEAPTTVVPTTIASTTAFVTDPIEAPTTEAPTTVVYTTATEDNSSFYTITIENAKTGATQSATAEAAEDVYDTFNALFDGITAGDYNVSVSYFDAETAHSSVCARTTWTSQAEANEIDSIKVNYYVVTEEIAVEVTAIHPGAGATYTIVVQNASTEDSTTATAEQDNIEGGYSALFENITAGTYNVIVYTFNEAGGNNSLCATTTWESQAAANEFDTIKVVYDPEKDKIDVSVASIYTASLDYTITVQKVGVDDPYTKEAAEINGTVSEDFYELEKGTYDIVVYKYNEEGAHSSLCAKTTWTCDASIYGYKNIKVSYNTTTDKLKVTVTANRCTHRFTTTKVTKKATYFAKGSKDIICKGCGETIETKSIAEKVLKTPTVSVKATKKAIKVNYKKAVKDATGIQISYKLKSAKKYTTVTVKTAKAATQTIKKLKSGKTYNVKVRAYIKSGSKKAYSSWTKTNKVTVK
jgi:hypothetical protein